MSGSNPNGPVIGSSRLEVSVAGSIIGPVTLPADGTYTVVTDLYQSDTAQIALSVYDVVDVTGSISLDGSPRTAALNTPGQRALWTFSGTANQKVILVISATTVPKCSHLQLVRDPQAGRHTVAHAMGYVRRCDRRPSDVADYGDLHRARRSGRCQTGR